MVTDKIKFQRNYKNKDTGEICKVIKINKDITLKELEDFCIWFTKELNKKVEMNYRYLYIGTNITIDSEVKFIVYLLDNSGFEEIKYTTLLFEEFFSPKRRNEYILEYEDYGFKKLVELRHIIKRAALDIIENKIKQEK